MRTTSPVASLAFVLAAGCGSGDGGGDDPPRESAGTIYANAHDYGHMTEGVASSGLRWVAVGNDASGREIRGLMLFDLQRIPLGARIVSATLRVRQTAVEGDPYPGLGPVVLDHVDVGLDPYIDDAFEWLAYDLDHFFPVGPGVDLALGVAELSSDAALDEKTADVTAALQEAIDLSKPTFDLRLRFSSPSDSDSESDLATFASGPETPGGPASIDVVYTL